MFSTQVEYRKEENEFTPGETFASGLARNTTGQGSAGEAEFVEYGLELSIPIFGEDFTLPFVKSLVLEGAVRRVERDGEGGPFNLTSSSEDDVFNLGLRWKPIDDLTVRGSVSSAIRSPSIVELFGAGITGFSTLGRADGNPCDEDVIDSGPAIRRTNCEAFVESLGLDVSVLEGFQAPGGAAPAAGASNPGLENEESDSWTAGFVYTPSFIKGLTVSFDYYELELTGEIGLAGLGTECFDSPTFPEALVGGFDACNALVFAVEDPNNPGSFIVPSVNPINGQPVNPVANPGTPAQDQQALTSTFSFFPTLNQGSTQIRSYLLTADYGFDAGSLGAFRVNGSAYRLLEFSETAAGNTNPRDGEDGDAEWNTVLTVSHQLGALSHNLQWFFTSSTLDNVQTDPSTFSELPADFRRPSFNVLNYSARYAINENFTAQFVVNNIADRDFNPTAFETANGLGRRFSVGLTAKF